MQSDKITQSTWMLCVSRLINCIQRVTDATVRKGGGYSFAFLWVFLLELNKKNQDDDIDITAILV